MSKLQFPENIVFKTFPISFGKVRYQYQKYILPPKIKKYFDKNLPQIKNLDVHFYAAEQIHKNKVSIVNSKKHFYPNADGLITNQKNLLLTVRHSDCVPIFLYDQKQKVISLVHSGWKGTVLEIATKAVKKMQSKFNSNPKDIFVKIGPHAKSCCYKFDSNWPHSTLLSNSKWDRFVTKKRKYYYLNMQGFIKQSLIEIRVKKENITISRICTICSKHYFSWTIRRNKNLAPQNNLSIAFMI